MMTEKNNEAPKAAENNNGARTVEIHPDGAYAIKGSTILAILGELKATIPIAYSKSVFYVEELLAQSQPISFLKDQKPASTVPPAGANNSEFIENKEG